MGWFLSTLEAVKDATGHDPVECPRGWGQVSFVGTVWVIPPMVGADRRCPIGGVASCGECSYASNPDPARLAAQLQELDRLRSERVLETEEYDIRRRALLELHAPTPGRKFVIAACVLAPLGAVVLGLGVALAAQVHPGFLAVASVGAVLLALSVSFWAVARSLRSTGNEQH